VKVKVKNKKAADISERLRCFDIGQHLMGVRIGFNLFLEASKSGNKKAIREEAKRASRVLGVMGNSFPNSKTFTASTVRSLDEIARGSAPSLSIDRMKSVIGKLEAAGQRSCS